jgi:hypothetical protein
MGRELSPGNLANLAPAEKLARIKELNDLLTSIPQAATLLEPQLIQLAAPSGAELAEQFNNFSVTGRASRHTPPNRK